jgi:hypothetical protein
MPKHATEVALMPVRRTAALVALALVLGAACGSNAAQLPSKTIELRTLNASGVSGQAVLSDLGNGRTRVDVRVNPAGHPDMPSHIHPGTCANLVPQPRYPLESVKNGSAATEIPVGLAELLQQQAVVMTHKSNDEMGVYTSCGEIR